MAASLTATTIFGTLAAGNQNLSLFDAQFSSLITGQNTLNNFGNYYADSGSANAYAITVPTAQSYTFAAGLPLQFRALATNTGTACTLQITSAATSISKSLVMPNGATPPANTIIANGIVTVISDGTSFQIVGVSGAVTPALRGYLAGLGMSTAGGSTSVSVAAGMATDSTFGVLMTLATSITKTSAAWAVGTGNGGLDTGAFGNVWYHFFVIERLDTGVVDVIFSTSASTPTLPTNYTPKRRIGSGLVSGGTFVSFVQDGDLFQLVTPVLETTGTNPGTNAVTQTLNNVPTGVNVIANMNVSGSGSFIAYMSDLATADLAPSASASPLGTTGAGGVAQFMAQASVRTSTAAAIRTRISASGGGQQLFIVTLGWRDRRGQDA